MLESIDLVSQAYNEAKYWYENFINSKESLSPAGVQSLKKTIIKYYDYKIKEENILVTHGSTQAIFLVALAYLSKGDIVSTFDPYFYQYKFVTDLFCGKFHPIPLLVENGKVIVDWEQFEYLSKETVKLFYFNTPHNPTGKIFSKDEISKVIAGLGKDTIILYDEVYSEHAEKGRSLSMIQPKMGNTIVTNSLSKSHNRSDLRIGWMIASPEIIKKMIAIQDVILFSLSLPTQKEAVKVLSSESDKNSLHLLENFNFLKDRCDEEILVFPYEAGEYIFIVLPIDTNIELVCKSINQKFASNVCMPGGLFSERYPNGIRVHIAKDLEILKVVLEGIRGDF